MLNNSDYAIFWFVAELNFSKNRLRLVESGLSLLKTNRIFKCSTLVDFQCRIHNKWSVVLYWHNQLCSNYYWPLQVKMQRVPKSDRSKVFKIMFSIWKWYFHGSKNKNPKSIIRGCSDPNHHRIMTFRVQQWCSRKYFNFPKVLTAELTEKWPESFRFPQENCSVADHKTLREPYRRHFNDP